jgi:hypothetical protein
MDSGAKCSGACDSISSCVEETQAEAKMAMRRRKISSFFFSNTRYS